MVWPALAMGEAREGRMLPEVEKKIDDVTVY
jgi:hypothetical protein